MKSARLAQPREGGCAAPLYRSQRLGDRSTAAAAPPHPFRGLPQPPGRSLRPAAPHNISRCKWPNPETRRENASQSEAADSRFPPPFAPPLIGKATAPLSPLPNHPHLSPPRPTRGEVAHPLASSPGCLQWGSPLRRRRLSPCHPHPHPLPDTPLLSFPVLLLVLLRVICILTPAGDCQLLCLISCHHRPEEKKRNKTKKLRGLLTFSFFLTTSSPENFKTPPHPLFPARCLGSCFSMREKNHQPTKHFKNTLPGA